MTERIAPAKKQAVDAPRQSVFLIRPEKLTLIGLDTDDGPEHCLYDETVHDDPDEALAESLAEYGQRQNLVVRKNGERMEVVSGRTRCKAARLWNDAHPDDAMSLACVVVRGKQDTELLEMMIVENEHRTDKPVIVKAKQAQRLLDRNRTPAQVAKVFRVSTETVRSWTRNLDLAPEIQTAMEGGLSVEDAQSVATLEHKDQRAVLELAKDTGQSLKKAAESAGLRLPPRRRGSSHTPSCRPGLSEIRAALEDETIEDDAVTWRRFAKWIVGDVPYLLSNKETE